MSFEILAIVVTVQGFFLIASGKAILVLLKDLRELREVHQATCKRLETAQCKNKCKYLAGDKILNLGLLED